MNIVVLSFKISPAARPSARPGPAEPIYINSRSTAKRLLLVSYHTTLYDAMLSHAMPYTLIFSLGASTWPKASEPWAEEGAGFQFGCWHLAQSLRAPGQGWGAGSGPPSPAQGSEAPGQVPNLKKTKKTKNPRKLKNPVF